MTSKQARANVDPVRQRTQYSCVAASLAMALKAVGVRCDEDSVDEILGAVPGRGSAWDQAVGAAQYFGARVTLVCPSTIEQLKEWTDANVPVLIGWCPEGRPWGHASCVFDVKDDGTVLVADPNIPDPAELVRRLSRQDFYKKWYEPGGDYLVRRTAMAVEPEIVGGRSRTARNTKKNHARRMCSSLPEVAAALRRWTDEVIRDA
jgi:ABC-type bacteriocin/lantibiotic exporter with double-glycine peptidase domain